MKRIIFILLIAGLTFSCKKNDKGVNLTEVKQIKYGTSFGECLGYCKSDILLQPWSVIYTNSGWSDTLKTITCKDTLTNWSSFISGLDTRRFFALQAIIGCPDCADGGAEWIEVELVSGEKHRVTFEYMNAPEVLKDYVIKLREQKEQSSHCGK